MLPEPFGCYFRRVPPESYSTSVSHPSVEVLYIVANQFTELRSIRYQTFGWARRQYSCRRTVGVLLGIAHLAVQLCDLPRFHPDMTLPIEPALRI